MGAEVNPPPMLSNMEKTLIPVLKVGIDGGYDCEKEPGFCDAAEPSHADAEVSPGIYH